MVVEARSLFVDFATAVRLVRETARLLLLLRCMMLAAAATAASWQQSSGSMQAAAAAQTAALDLDLARSTVSFVNLTPTRKVDKSGESCMRASRQVAGFSGD